MTDARAERVLTDAQRADLARALRAARWIGLVIPLGIAAIGTALLLVWLPRMPDPIAIHWGTSGEPNGFGPAWTGPVFAAGLGFGVTLLMWAFAVFPTRNLTAPAWAPTQRFLAAFSLGTALFCQVLMVGTGFIQLDIHDAREAPGLGLGMAAVGFGLWALGTIAGWIAQPSVVVVGDSRVPSQPLELADTERADWVGEIRPARGYLWIITVTLLLLLGTTVLAFSYDGLVGWVTAGVFLLMLLLAVPCSAFGVRIDERGLEIRGLFGWPVFRIAADDVKRVEAAQINPLAEFGGWGLRWMPGRMGIVMRAGEGIVVTRNNGRVLGATLDDAEGAASALATAARNAREQRG